MSTGFVNKPWGFYQDIFRTKETCLKRITVFPNQRPSLQLHYKREEIWIIQSGKGLVTLDNVEFEASSGDIIRVRKEEVHRIKCISDENLVFIELQTGICEEEDIIRLEDDYKR